MNRIPDPPPAAPPEPGEDPRVSATDADLGELILFIGRIRRELDAGSPLHSPDMKPLARRAERILGLLPQLPRAHAQRLLPRLERVMTELDAVETVLRERKLVLDRALADQPPAGPGQGKSAKGPVGEARSGEEKSGKGGILPGGRSRR